MSDFENSDPISNALRLKQLIAIKHHLRSKDLRDVWKTSHPVTFADLAYLGKRADKHQDTQAEVKNTRRDTLITIAENIKRLAKSGETCRVGRQELKANRRTFHSLPEDNKYPIIKTAGKQQAMRLESGLHRRQSFLTLPEQLQSLGKPSQKPRDRPAQPKAIQRARDDSDFLAAVRGQQSSVSLVDDKEHPDMEYILPSGEPLTLEHREFFRNLGRALPEGGRDAAFKALNANARETSGRFPPPPSPPSRWSSSTLGAGDENEGDISLRKIGSRKRNDGKLFSRDPDHMGK